MEKVNASTLRSRRFRARHPGCDQQYRRDNYAKVLEKQRSYYHERGGREKALTLWLKRKLAKVGLTIKQYHELAKAGCGVCGASDGGNGGRLHIDHCHETGQFRGLLCSKCNTAIGLAGDDPERLMALADYLRNAAKWRR